jgi:uncharacterized protein YjiK
MTVRMSIWALLLTVDVSAQSLLTPLWTRRIGIPEPSDLVWDAQRDSFLVVSDNGLLYTLSKDGLAFRKVFSHGSDFEAITLSANTVLAVDESERRIYRFNRKDLTLSDIFPVSFLGARNRGFEAASHDPAGKVTYLITEKEPSRLYILNDLFALVGTIDLRISSDVSAAVWHEGKLWVLSDEDRKLLVLSSDHRVEKSWRVKVHNPEGLAFGPDGDLYIVSDDMQLLTRFNKADLR